MNSIFIRSESLGSIVEARLLELVPAGLKRKRRQNFKAIARLLRDLHLVPHFTSVVALGLGANADGDTGLIVAFETEKIEGSIA
jgi:hypothetical protein